MNLLLMGKLYDKLGQRDKAVAYVKRARDFVQVTDDDIAVSTLFNFLFGSWVYIELSNAHRRTKRPKNS
jgi:alpha/beta superfamily hydrolase